MSGLPTFVLISLVSYLGFLLLQMCFLRRCLLRFWPAWMNTSLQALECVSLLNRDDSWWLQPTPWPPESTQWESTGTDRCITSTTGFTALSTACCTITLTWLQYPSRYAVMTILLSKVMLRFVIYSFVAFQSPVILVHLCVITNFTGFLQGNDGPLYKSSIWGPTCDSLDQVCVKFHV